MPRVTTPQLRPPIGSPITLTCRCTYCGIQLASGDAWFAQDSTDACCEPCMLQRIDITPEPFLGFDSNAPCWRDQIYRMAARENTPFATVRSLLIAGFLTTGFDNTPTTDLDALCADESDIEMERRTR